MCRFWCYLSLLPPDLLSLFLSLTLTPSPPPSLSYPQISPVFLPRISSLSLTLNVLSLSLTAKSPISLSHFLSYPWLILISLTLSFLLSSFSARVYWLFLEMEIHIPHLTNNTSPLASHKQEHKNPVSPHSIIHGENRMIQRQKGFTTCSHNTHTACFCLPRHFNCWHFPQVWVTTSRFY